LRWGGRVGEGQLLGYGGQFGAQFGAAQAGQAAEEAEVLAQGGGGVEGQFLGCQADQGACGTWSRGEICSRYEDRARVGPFQAGDDAGEGRLARAVVADQAADLAGLDPQVEAVQGPDGAPPFAQAADGQHGHSLDIYNVYVYCVYVASREDVK